MANWDDGYVTDVPYVTDYQQEATPLWIATMATLLGVAAPDVTRPFRYADLGCGNGVTAQIVAATMPHAEVWAFDFNPAHIESCRDIARRAGLTNIHFEEASFAELANRAAAALPEFDYIVAHGVLSWVSLENRRRLFNVIGQRVAPGGMVYISYNSATGWTGIRPVRALMRLLAEASPERSDVASRRIFNLLDRMRDAGAAMFQEHPTLHQRLSAIAGHDQSYVAHELLNRDWHPVMFPAVASAMAAVKCGYVGNATPQNNRTGLTVPAAMQPMFERIRDPRLRETVRDIACATNFRRDLFQRGPRRLSLAEQAARTGAIGVVRTFQPLPDPIAVRTALGPLTLDQRLGRALLEALGGAPETLSRLYRHASLAEWPAELVLEVATLLIGDNTLAPVVSGPLDAAAVAAAARLNALHATLFDQGYDRLFLACPALGGAWYADPRDILVLDELRHGHVADWRALTDTVLARVARTGRQLRQSGQTVTDLAAVREVVAGKVFEMLEHRLPVLRRLGVLDAAGGEGNG
jgi:SAM-dependent methyltransferase